MSEVKNICFEVKRSNGDISESVKCVANRSESNCQAGEEGGKVNKILKFLPNPLIDGFPPKN